MEYEVREICSQKTIVFDMVKHWRAPSMEEIRNALQKEFPGIPLQNMHLHEGAGHGFLYCRPISSR